MIKYSLYAVLLFFTCCKGVSQEQKQNDSKTKTVVENQKPKSFPVQKSEEEWEQQLPKDAFYVLRKAATENPFSSELLENKGEGTYMCAGCNAALFSSETKFDSGTGWPSFYEEIDGAVVYDVDFKVGYKRTEELCAHCGGHLGHMFEDGPAPTGERHCINGVALRFVQR